MGRSGINTAALNQQLLQYMQLSDSMANRDAITEERKRRDLELESAKERELNIKETAADEQGIKRDFEAAAGVPLDAETRKYAAPFEKVAQEKARLRSNIRSQPQQYEEQGFFDRLAGKPRVPKPKMGYAAPEVDPAEVAAIKPQIRAETRRNLEALGYIGDANRINGNPNFDEDMHRLFQGEDAPVVAPGKAQDYVKGVLETKKLKALTKQEEVKSSIAQRTEEDYVKQQGLETGIKEQTLRKGVIDADIAAWNSAQQPIIEADRQAMEILKRKLEEAKVANIPIDRAHTQAQIASLAAGTEKTRQDIAKVDKKSKLAAMWWAETDPKKKNDLGRQIMVEDGHLDKVLDQDYKASDDAVKYSLESSKAYAKAKEIEARTKGKDIAGIESYLKSANVAATRSAALGGHNLVTMYNVKSDPGFGIGDPTAQIESVIVARDYAKAKLDGNVSDFIYAPIPEGATPDEIKKKIYPGQAAMLGWSLIDNFPGLRGNIEAFDAKVDTIPNIGPEVKARAKSYMADQMGKARKTEEQAATLKAVEPREISRDPVDRAVEGVKDVTGRVVSTLKKGKMSPEMDLSGDIKESPKLPRKTPGKLEAATKEETPPFNPPVQVVGKTPAQNEPDTPTIKDVRSQAVEVFKAGKRFKSPKDATFPEWIAEQAARSGQDPNNFTAKEFASFWKLWDKAR